MENPGAAEGKSIAVPPGTCRIPHGKLTIGDNWRSDLVRSRKRDGFVIKTAIIYITFRLPKSFDCVCKYCEVLTLALQSQKIPETMREKLTLWNFVSAGKHIFQTQSVLECLRSIIE